jgi:hypothetical protein
VGVGRRSEAIDGDTDLMDKLADYKKMKNMTNRKKT